MTAWIHRIDTRLPDISFALSSYVTKFIGSNIR
jgi:hypothetical protein